jgi:hypothetical protein
LVGFNTFRQSTHPHPAAVAALFGLALGILLPPCPSARARSDRGPQGHCGVQTDGSLWCWGGNSDCQLGDGTTGTRGYPVKIGSATDWAQVSVGDTFTCGTRTDGTLWCWGDNTVGQGGDGSAFSRTPIAIVK